MSTKKRRAKNAPHKPANSPNTANSARRQATTASPADDPADFLTNVVEDDAIEEKPKVNTELTKTDRAAILGQDGRWAAGWALRFIIMVAAGYLLWRGLALVWEGLLPVLLAIIVSTVLWPPVRWLRKHKVPSALSVVIVLVTFFAILGGIFTAMAPSITTQSRDLAEQATKGIGQLQQWIQGPPLNVDLGHYNDIINQISTFLQERVTDIASRVVSGISTAGSIVVTFVLMLVLTFFFLKDGEGFLPMIRRTTGHNVGWHLTEVLTRIWNTLSGFIRVQAIISFVDAVCIGIGLLVLHVPLAPALAVITFFASFIPIVGALVAGALAVIIALVSNGVTNALLVLLIIIAVQQLEGHILQPVLQSKAMNLHAAIVLLSVTIGSTMFGVVGAFLAVPVAATLSVLVRYHFELVALRAGEITIDDIEMATKESHAMPSKDDDADQQSDGSNLTSTQRAFQAFQQRLARWGKTSREKS
ncbi:AI-2E family transporter [Corynebacterium matruchotii]|uniref:AI-2E family transporter n=1 Tax=Corynebacterium matruchotii TaxID=43768 RepID=UPI0028EC4E73|nr:AI-2E family transporter [Corynebacterium matruchotii]